MQFARLLLTAPLIFASALTARAQTTGASVRVAGQVSATVSVSVGAPTEVKGGPVRVNSRQVDLQTAVLTLSGDDTDNSELLIPVRLRSNAAFALSGSARAKGATLESVFVRATRATGRFVAAGALDAMKITEGIDSRTQTPASAERGKPTSPALGPTPVVLLTGPGISTAGALSSPDNAAEVILSLVVKASPSKRPWELEFVLSADCVKGITSSREEAVAPSN